ncbi:MAG: LemA family protein [Candidatus Hydrogenedentes bacterium]|nr:LemA family protein [Candidatus Hydrogenedentota bacterium]
MFLVLAVIGGGALLVFLWGAGIYNGLVRARNAVKNAWSQIDVQLKRRHDLIPNLIETCKGYMAHERDTLENITKARNLAMGAQSVGEHARAESQLGQALSNIFAVAENYPDLKANTNFLALQEELTSTENKIGFARQAYNDQAMHLNNKIEMFPGSLVAGVFNFEAAEFFEIEDAAERAVPKVSFS